MADKIIENNQVSITGKITTGFSFSHQVYGEGFYTMELLVKRLSDSEDRIPVMVSERLVAGGFLLAGEWEMRVKMLGIFRQMAVYLKARILYSNETLPEALKEIGSRFSDGNSGMAAEAGLFFLRVEKRMEEEAGKPFAEIWKEEMEKFPDDLPLRKQDLEALQALGENLGYADKKTQERTILFYLEQADDSLAFLKKEMESRTKLYRSLGMAAGLFILVLFA